MGIFDNKETLERIEKLEKLTQQLNTTFETLASQQKTVEKQISEIIKTTPEYEAEAKVAAENTLTYAQDSSEILEKLQEVLDEVKANKKNIEEQIHEASELVIEFNEQSASIEKSRESFSTTEKEILESIESVEKKIEQIEEVFENHPDINKEIETIEGLLSNIGATDGKSTQLLKTITARKNDIDRLHEEIIGFTETDSETDEETYISGLKDELENAYKGLDEKIGTVKTDMNSLYDNSLEKYNSFLGNGQKEKDEIFKKWEGVFEGLKKKIQSLLPNALTVGLSYAYAEKRREETIENVKFETTFKWAIAGLVCISLIPFALTIYAIFKDTDIEIIIKRIPREVLAILPLYIPVMWVAYSSNRKMNLSKRLIEEYSHKEALSKTFEGLSGQINNISDTDISSELRTKLLFTLLEVNSENPGKLISDYNKSDHPLMDALEKSIKLTESVDKLSKIPGLKKLSEVLEKRSNALIDVETKKVEDGLDLIEEGNELQ